MIGPIKTTCRQNVESVNSDKDGELVWLNCYELLQIVTDYHDKEGQKYGTLNKKAGFNRTEVW